mgnify:CR=1 FL=1
MTMESESVINAPEKQRVSTNEGTKPQLRMVDLNLLTVFDAVMQEQNITRAAHMSRAPAYAPGTPSNWLL